MFVAVRVVCFAMRVFVVMAGVCSLHGGVRACACLGRIVENLLDLSSDASLLLDVMTFAWALK